MHLPRMGLNRNRRSCGRVNRCLLAAIALSVRCPHPSFRLSTGGAWCSCSRAELEPSAREVRSVFLDIIPISEGKEKVPAGESGFPNFLLTFWRLHLAHSSVFRSLGET